MPRTKLDITDEERAERIRRSKDKYVYNNREKERKRQSEYYEKNRESLIQKRKERKARNALRQVQMAEQQVEQKQPQVELVRERNEEELARRLTQKLNRELGIDGIIKPSKRRDKRFTFVPALSTDGVHFGSRKAITFVDGASDKKRLAYQLRASKIKNKKGELTFKKKFTANFFSYHLLW